MKYSILKTLIVSLFLATSAEAGKVEQKEASEMPVMLVMKRRAPHLQDLLKNDNIHVKDGPKFMMMRSKEDENPLESMDPATALMGMGVPSISGMGVPPLSVMTLPPPPLLGMGGVSNADFLHMQMQTEMVHEIQNVEKQMSE